MFRTIYDFSFIPHMGSVFLYRVWAALRHVNASSAFPVSCQRPPLATLGAVGQDLGEDRKRINEGRERKNREVERLTSQQSKMTCRQEGENLKN